MYGVCYPFDAQGVCCYFFLLKCEKTKDQIRFEPLLAFLSFSIFLLVHQLITISSALMIPPFIEGLVEVVTTPLGH